MAERVKSSRFALGIAASCDQPPRTSISDRAGRRRLVTFFLFTNRPENGMTR